MLPQLLTFTSLALSVAATAAPDVFEREEAHWCKPKIVTTTVFQPTTIYMTAGAPPSSPSTPVVHPPRPISESYHPQSSTVIPPSVPTTRTVSLSIQSPMRPTTHMPIPVPIPSSKPTISVSIQPTIPVPVPSSNPTVSLSIQPTISVPAPSPNPSSPSSPITPNPVHSGGKYANALYFTNWGIYGANFQPQQIPAGQVTHILYAFADIGSDGEVKSSDSWADVQKHYDGDSWNDSGNNAYGCVKQLFIHKKNNRNLKVLLSIGGWTYSPKFAPVAATDAGRQRFASTAVKLVADWGFDGIDIDWEYPENAQQAQDYISLLQACRQALDAYAAQNAPGYHFLITVASPAGSQNYNNMDLKGMDPYVDSWHLMAYDYAGSWDTTSGHQANLFSNPNNMASTKFCTESAVDDYLAKGISASKIVLGLPLYGRSFMKTASLGQPYSGEGQGSIENGIWLYKDLPRSGAQVDYDDVAKESYTYDPSTGELVSYDDIQSATVKAQWLLQKGLGGAFFWEASGDKTGSQSLVGTMASQLGSLDGSQNLLSYPASQYANIKAGMP